ncbi:MAG: DUF1934 domain-containing protein [Sporosarcina sp.]
MESREKERNVKIKLQSSIRHPGQDEEKHELNATGLLIEKAGKPYLKYEEEQGGKRIQTIVRLDSSDALIMRRGAVNMRLPFIEAGERSGTYGNGPAAFDLVVKTEKLDFTERKDGSGGRFNVNYNLHAEGSLLGTYELTITYTEGTI